MTPPDFWIVPTVIQQNKKLYPNDWIIYAIVYWMKCLKNDRCVAANTTIANLARAETRTVQNSLTRLENEGCIKRVYFDKTSRHRAEIIPLISYRAPYETPIVGLRNAEDSPLRNADDQNKSINNNSNKDIAASAPRQGFDLKDEIKKLKESPQRHIQLIGEYLEERKVSLETKEQLQRAIHRHLRSARALADFTDKQIAQASSQAAKEYPAWTIETVIKILTR